MVSHLTFSSDGRHPLFPTLELRRKAVRCIAAIGPEVILFCVVDDHAHVVIHVIEAARIGRIAAGLYHALRPIAAAPILPAFVRPVETRRHLDWLADQYILCQTTKHGIAEHPALYEGSCFADLIRARVVFDPPLVTRLGKAAPRYRLRRAYKAVGLAEEPITPVSDATLRALGVSKIAAATEAALAAPPGMKGNSAVEALGRCAVGHLAKCGGVGSAECAFALGIEVSSVSRLQRRPVPESVLLAVRLRLALELRVAADQARSNTTPDVRSRIATEHETSASTSPDRSQNATEPERSSTTS
jgi:hypothetical protein